MNISLIVAMDRQHGIGIQNTLPWRLSGDLRLFKERTMGHHIIVGRKTYESIGRALPGRHMIVLSSQAHYMAEGCDTVSSFEAALALAESRSEREIFVCGGAEVYRLALPHCSTMYVTDVHAELPCDAHFPVWNVEEWKELGREHHRADERNEYDWDVVTYVRQHKV